MQPDLELVQVGPETSFKAWAHGYPYRTVRWHFHPECELHLVTHTSGTFMVGDHVGTFEPGHLVLIGPNLPHNWISATEPGEVVPERGLVLQFTRESIAAAARGFPELAGLETLLGDASRGIEFGPGLAGPAGALMTELIAATGVRRLAVFLELLDRLAHHPRRPLLGPEYRFDPGAATAGTINHVLAHIDTHLDHDLREADLAALCGRSASAFSRLFRQHTGMGFSRYVNRLRIDRACHLLMAGDRPVTEICFEVGFNNVSNFNRQFLAHKGVAPSRFRASHRLVAAPAGGPAPGGRSPRRAAPATLSPIPTAETFP
ncbi:AraC family transcriptional regulator [uncultured Methylobacterium sp.]|uniref:AraC family transcriptional regulator n=1 Tax=uncultured Methylobacterium sp. TaxID=157278 RepID=UPI0025990A06|nr:AraC family transcriptional regulator [uncultured Methylobacterium sp.]